MLARRPAAKILVHDQDAGSRISRLVQHEFGIVLALGRAPPVMKQELTEAGALNALQKLLRNDLVGIHIDAVKRSDQACVRAKWLHANLSKLLPPSSLSSPRKQRF